MWLTVLSSGYPDFILRRLHLFGQSECGVLMLSVILQMSTICMFWSSLLTEENRDQFDSLKDDGNILMRAHARLMECCFCAKIMMRKILWPSN